MNKIITILALSALLAAPLMAVPSGINYQGALTDDQGNPFTGTRTMGIKLYDAATGGTLLYNENIGDVDVSDGVFSFEFGAGGTSNAQQTDTVAITDGSATSFQKVLSAAEVVAGSVSVTDGTYTWSQSGGSSNENDFGVAYNTSLRRVTVTYFNGAPAAGRTITATYRTPASGISGALAGDNQPWAEITVDGVAQVPRQKVLAVPFSNFASRAASLVPTTAVATLPMERFTSTLRDQGSGYGTNTTIPLGITKIQKMAFTYALSSTAYASANSGYGVSFNLQLRAIDPQTGVSTTLYSFSDEIRYPRSATFTNTVTCGPFDLPRASKYYVLEAFVSNAGSQNWGSANSGSFQGVVIDYTKE